MSRPGTAAHSAKRLWPAAYAAIQSLLPKYTLSRFAYWLARRERPWVCRPLIALFVRAFGVDLTESAQTAREFRSFNDFFTRRLRPGARPQPHDASAVLSPVDGQICDVGTADELTLIQGKRHPFSLTALLGGNDVLARRLAGCSYLTVYLAPGDYHRVHMPVAGTLRSMLLVPGRRYSVDAATTEAVRDLFARNERVVCAFDTPMGPVVVVLVGALLVGSISTAWHGEVTPRDAGVPQLWDYPASGSGSLHLQRGEELGLFNMGSTVIVMLPRARVAWRAELAAGDTVRVREAVGRLI